MVAAACGSSGSSTAGTARPLLTLADVQHVLRAPPGYTQPANNAATGGNDEGACGKQTALTPPGPTNSATLNREVGPHGAYSSQFVEVLKSHSAALHFAQTVSEEVPCSQWGPDGSSMSWTKSSQLYSYLVSVKGPVAATAIIDLIPVRNVIYFNDDVALGRTIDAKAHYEQTSQMVATLEGLA